MQARSPAVVALFLAGMCYLPARLQAADQRPDFISVITENDNYASRNDRHYSSGLRLVLALSPDEGAWYHRLGDLLPLGHITSDREYSAGLGQSIYTPEAFAAPEPQPGDRPFAGWLYGELAASARAGRTRETLALSLGVVGPAALGEFGQTLLHEFTGDPEPRGWPFQLDNEPALLLRYTRHWFRPLGREGRMDIVPGLGLSLGNVTTGAHLSLLWRYGSFLSPRLTHAAVQPATIGADPRFDFRRGETDWQVSLGGGLSAVAHNLFLDGNTFSDSLSVERRPLVFDAVAGLQWTFGKWAVPARFSFNLVLQGREFEGQEELDRYGSVAVRLQY